ncbi:MAG: N-acetyltransferase [Chloroflexi bacterium]|nr:MAG: N-acetyltransferase [Chloroflexota bacterium]
MDTTQQMPEVLYNITQASWRDLNALRDLEKVCFPKDAWPLWDLVAVLTLPNVVRLKAEIDGRFAGFVAADIRTSEKLAWIATIGVLPEFRNQGLGAALLEACEVELTAIHRIRLCVRVSNDPAIHLYEQHGYSRVEIWPRYYSDHENALVMEKIFFERTG